MDTFYSSYLYSLVHYTTNRQTTKKRKFLDPVSTGASFKVWAHKKSKKRVFDLHNFIWTF